MFPFIIELIYWSLISNDIRILIFSLLKEILKRDSNSSFKKTLKEENINEDELDQPFSLFNPNIINKLIKLITPNELNILKSELNKIKKLGKNINKIFNKKNINNDNKINNNENEELKENNLNENSLLWTNLSSSWFKKGNFNLTDSNSNIGILITLFQSDTAKNKIWYGPYTYPSFPKEIWELMKEQKGKNGSGAGTIFWRYWNKYWLPAQLRKYVKKRLNKQGITSGNKNKNITLPKTINVAKTTAYIHRLEYNFIKLKKFSNLSNTDIGSLKWKQARTDIFKYQSNWKNKSKEEVYNFYKVKKNKRNYNRWK